MNKNTKGALIILAFLVLVGILAGFQISKNNKIKTFNAESAMVAGYAKTTTSRIANAVVTLPEGSILSGLKNNSGTYTYSGREGKVTAESDMLATKYIPGVYGSTHARLDAVVPMAISRDAYGGSTYVMLWNDRGDATLLKSYARLGSLNVKVISITFLDSKDAKEEYKVDIKYTINGVNKEIIIPVADGKFVDINNPAASKSASKPSINSTLIVKTEPMIACTLEAKQCGDGSYVSRSGPACQFALCPSPAGSSGIKGQINLGPTCPVEQLPPDPSCAPKPYKTTLKISRKGSGMIFKSILTDGDGQFQTDLPEGSYTIANSSESMFPTCPQTDVIVASGAYSQVDISCDTGIR